MKLAGKELSEADRANQLLNRRVNEWLGNNRNPRFLLEWRELWLIQKQKPYLILGANRQHKERLLSASKRRFQLLFSGLIGFLAVVGLLWLGTEYLLSTPEGQIQQVRWELEKVSQRIDSNQAAAYTAIAFAKDGNLKKALEIIEDQIDYYSRYKARALRAIAQAQAKLSNWGKARQASEKITIQDRKAISLAQILTIWAEKQHPELVEKQDPHFSQTD